MARAKGISLSLVSQLEYEDEEDRQADLRLQADLDKQQAEEDEASKAQPRVKCI